MDLSSDEYEESSDESNMREYYKHIIWDIVKQISDLNIEDDNKKEIHLKRIIQYDFDFDDLHDLDNMMIPFTEEERDFITATLIKNLRFPIVKQFAEDVMSYMYPLPSSFNSRYAKVNDLPMKDWMTYVDIFRKLHNEYDSYCYRGNFDYLEMIRTLRSNLKATPSATC